MTTGDLKNNARKLLSQLKLIHYSAEVDWNGLASGLSQCYLPILHHLFLNFSQELASYLSDKGYDFYAKSDLRFMEIVYKILLQEFSFKPSLSKEKFFATGFAERKIMLVTHVIELCREKHSALCRGLSKKSRLKDPGKRCGQGLMNKVHLSGPLEEAEPCTSAGVTATDKEDLVTIIPAVRQLDEDSTKDVSNKVTSNISPLKPPVPSARVQAEQPPKPSDILTLTPMKPEDKTPYNGEYSVEVVDVPETSDDGTSSPPILVERHSRLRLQRTSDLPRLTANLETNNNATDGTLSLKTSKVSSQDYSNVNAQSVSCSECRRVQETLGEVMNDLKTLKANFVEVSSLNNELAARVVLLESRSKILEDRLDHFMQTAGKEFSNDGEERHAGRNKEEERAREDSPILAEAPKSTSIRKSMERYSPEKYSDAWCTLPNDFRPLDLEELGSAYVERTQDQGSDLQRHVETEKIRTEGFLTASDQIFEPLRSSGTVDVTLDTFDTPLRIKLMSVEQKLMETKNILKQSSLIPS